MAKRNFDEAKVALAEVEKYADRLTTKAAMKRIRERAAEAILRTPAHRTTADDFIWYAIRDASTDKLYPKVVGYTERVWASWESLLRITPHPTLVRDVFGNPFRPITFDPVWRIAFAVGLARVIYESRDFAAMPVLADALEEAGCEHPDVLAHCRVPEQVHVRGCWVVDLVLGKS